MTDRRPPWLQKKICLASHAPMEQLLQNLQLNTVCREAHCPNISECYGAGQVTFLILGTRCTRQCSFCNITKREPVPPDRDEPRRIAVAISRLHLRHVVVTSPTRDDLDDGGAEFFAETVAEIRVASPQTRVELLIPDFHGSEASLSRVIHSRPDILGHNVETVPRLYTCRTGADYSRSLRVLASCREQDSSLETKSAIMLGLGETEEEVLQVMSDLRRVGCQYLSIGQYLAPSKQHHPVREYVPPERFTALQQSALALGFSHVESGPYVRSSYLAGRYGLTG